MKTKSLEKREKKTFKYLLLKEALACAITLFTEVINSVL
jgi:hypothetical protein